MGAKYGATPLSYILGPPELWQALSLLLLSIPGLGSYPCTLSIKVSIFSCDS